MSSKIFVRKYMTLAEFVAYLTNGRLPTDELFERQFDSVHPADKKERAAAELRARCILELGLVHVTGYRYTRLPLLSLPFISVITLIGFVGCSLFKRKIDDLIKERPLTIGLTACSLSGSPFAFKMLKPHYRIEQYRRLKRKYCPERQLYIDFIPSEEAAFCRFIEKDSYLPLQTPAAVLNKILKSALEDKGIVDGRIGITPDINRKLGSYRFDLSANRVFITYKNRYAEDSFLAKILSPLYRRYTGWEELQISTKDVLEKFPPKNKPDFECEYEWEKAVYSEKDLNVGEYDPQNASLYYTLCRDIYAALDLEHRFAEYSSADLRQEIVKRAPTVPEKRIEALLGVLPHKAKGGRPVGKKDENLRHTVSD